MSRTPNWPLIWLGSLALYLFATKKVDTAAQAALTMIIVAFGIVMVGMGCAGVRRGTLFVIVSYVLLSAMHAIVTAPSEGLALVALAVAAIFLVAIAWKLRTNSGVRRQ